MPRPPVVVPPVALDTPELIAELRRWRQDMTAQMAYYQRMDRWFRTLQERLGYPDEAPAHASDVRMVQGLDDVRGELEALKATVAELGTIVRTRYLTDEGTITQTFEAIRGLRAEVHDIPALSVAPVALAVGAVLRDAGLIQPVAEPEPRAVEVGASPRRRRKLAS